MQAFFQSNTVTGEAGVHHKFAAAETVGILDLTDESSDAFFFGKVLINGDLTDVYKLVSGMDSKPENR